MRTILRLNIFNETLIFKFPLLNEFPGLPFVKPARYMQQEEKKKKNQHSDKIQSRIP